MTTIEYMREVDRLLADVERYPATMRISAGSLACRIEGITRGLSYMIPDYAASVVGRFADGKTTK